MRGPKQEAPYLASFHSEKSMEGSGSEELLAHTALIVDGLGLQGWAGAALKGPHEKGR